MILFKYTGLEHIKSCIENGIYASRLDNINDPFEGKGIRYKEQYRVVCLTASPFQMLMWAYYGNHRGCCIEYEVDESIGIRQVEYIKEFLDHEDMNTTEIIESLYKKGNEWNHEKEYRMVYYSPQANKSLWKVDGENVFLRAKVKKITFGLASEMDCRYADILEFLSQYNNGHGSIIDITKCKLMRNRYQLEPDKQFDIDNELRVLRANNNTNKTITGTFDVYGGRYTEK